MAISLLAVSMLSGRCMVLDEGHSTRVVISTMKPQCYRITVPTQTGTQVSVEQPIDLAIFSANSAAQATADSFEFGPETLSLEGPGEYLIELRPAVSSPKSLSVLMTRRPISLQEVRLFRTAEEAATRGKHDQSPAILRESLHLWTKLPEKRAVARTYLALGDLSIENSREAARDLYEQGRTLCREISDARCTAEAENNSGLVSSRLGDFEAADRRLHDALESWRQIGDFLLQGRTLSNLGLLFWQAGDIQAAIAFYDRARPFLRSTDPLGYSKILNNLGLCYQSLAEYSTARSYFSAAYNQVLHLNLHRDALRPWLNLGRNALLTGSASAIPILTKVESAAEHAGDRGIVADACNNLGQALLRLGSVQAASVKLEQALSIDTEFGDRRAIASDLHFLGLASSASGNVTSARQFLHRALEIREDCRLRDDVTDTLFALARMEKDEHLPEAARGFLERAVNSLESLRRQVPNAWRRASFYSRWHKLMDLRIELAMSSEDLNSAARGFIAADQGRGRALLDILASGAQPVPGASYELQARRLRIQRRLDLLSATLSTAKAEEMVDLRRQAELLVAEDSEIDAAIRARTPPLPFGRPLESVAEVQQQLNSDWALLEFHLGETRSYLWLIRRNRLDVFHLPPGEVIDAQAKQIVRRFGDAVERRRNPREAARFSNDLQRLSLTLLGPLKNTLLPRCLIIVPDGSLHSIPFAALTLPVTGLRIGLRGDLIQIPAASYLLAGRRPRPFSSFRSVALALTDPVFSARDSRVHRILSSAVQSGSEPFSRLPFSKEIDTIRALVPPDRRQILHSFDASRQKLGELRVRDFAMVLFSTHAVIDDQVPELSRIIVSLVNANGKPVDGVLRPYQFSGLQLNGATVVLSACRTALGKRISGEGLAGFSSALFGAGAAQLVLTLTEVEAEASSEFLSRTYQHFLRGNGAGIEHALTLARREMASNPNWSDPYYWASFVVTGRPGSSGQASTFTRD